jgi:hypothetical protein
VRGNVIISRFVASNLIVLDGREYAARQSQQSFRDKVKRLVGKHNKRSSVNMIRIFSMKFLLHSIDVLGLNSGTKYSD